MDASAGASRTAQALFTEHGAAVYRFAAVLLRHHQDAEDVVQETFLKLLTHLRTCHRDDSNLRGWLFTVAAHAARDRLRRRNRWIPWVSAHDPAVRPQTPWDENGRVSAVRNALRRLSDRDRLLLALRAQGLSYRDMAAAAAIKPSSVGRLLARAVNRWHRMVKEDSYAVSQRSTDSGSCR